jgi:hypothetical protein
MKQTCKCGGTFICILGTYICESCHKEFEEHKPNVKPRKELSRRELNNIFKNQKEPKSWLPNGYKTSCSSSNYNNEPVYSGGLVRPN